MSEIFLLHRDSGITTVVAIDANSGATRTSVPVTGSPYIALDGEYGTMGPDNQIWIPTAYNVGLPQWIRMPISLDTYSFGPVISGIVSTDSLRFIGRKLFASNGSLAWLFADPTTSTAYTTWPVVAGHVGDESELEAPTTDGHSIYYTTEGPYIHKVNGVSDTIVLNLLLNPAFSENTSVGFDSDLQGTAYDRGFVYTWGINTSDSLDPLQMWIFRYNTVDGTVTYNRGVVTGISETFRASAVIVGNYYYTCQDHTFDSTIVYRARLNELILRPWITLGFGGSNYFIADGAGEPWLRLRQRDDQRVSRSQNQPTSRQASIRQGTRNTYS